MPPEITAYFVRIGASDFDLLFVFIIALALVVLWGVRAHDVKRFRMLREKDLKEVKQLKYELSVINAWAFAADKQIKLNGLKCGNSQGDKMLDWDGVPTLNDTVNK